MRKAYITAVLLRCIEPGVKIIGIFLLCLIAVGAGEIMFEFFYPFDRVEDTFFHLSIIHGPNLAFILGVSFQIFNPEEWLKETKAELQTVIETEEIARQQDGQLSEIKQDGQLSRMG